MQLQDLRKRINQEAAKSESGLTAAQRSVLKGRVAQTAPEVSRVRADIRTLAAQLHVTLSPASTGMLASDRATLLSQMGLSADDLLVLFMKLNTEDPPRAPSPDPKKGGDAEDAMWAFNERLLNACKRITFDLSNPTPTPTPHLSPRPSHD